MQALPLNRVRFFCPPGVRWKCQRLSGGRPVQCPGSIPPLSATTSGQCPGSVPATASPRTVRERVGAIIFSRCRAELVCRGQCFSRHRQNSNYQRWAGCKIHLIGKVVSRRGRLAGGAIMPRRRVIHNLPVRGTRSSLRSLANNAGTGIRAGVRVHRRTGTHFFGCVDVVCA